LVTFKDEVKKKDIKPLNPEEEEKRVQETLQFYKKKCWSRLKMDKDGKVKIFDEEDYKALHEKMRKK